MDPARGCSPGVESPLVVPLASVGLESIPQVGGKNASLGELIRHLRPAGVQVPSGFATTTAAYRLFLQANGLDQPLQALLSGLDATDLSALRQAGARARALILGAPLPDPLVVAIRQAYQELLIEAGDDASLPMAVRSSATAEDLPDASFAGQQETVLNVVGEPALLDACRVCFASLFTDRALSYRQEHGFNPVTVALSVGVQRLVRSDQACAGVMFSLDPDSGFPGVVLVSGSWGLGELVVQGAVNPDEWLVLKSTLEQGYAPILRRRLGRKEQRRVSMPTPSGPVLLDQPVPGPERDRYCLTEVEVLRLARWAVAIERHYSEDRGVLTPMDIEWAKDGPSGQLFILQARPETGHLQRRPWLDRRWELEPHGLTPILTGRAIGSAVVQGRVRLLAGPAEIERFQSGDVLVTGRTDPDWEPIMRIAAGIITDQGGTTCHAAILARELGVPAIVGTVEATHRLQDGAPVTLSCCQGEVGSVYEGWLPFRLVEERPEPLVPTRTRLLLNVADPSAVLGLASLPCGGVGLARLEFIMVHQLRAHPLALLHPDKVEDPLERAQLQALSAGYPSPWAYGLDRLVEGMAMIGAAFHPRPVLLRFSDFKSNEYGALLGGRWFEPREENPMLGWRGAIRYGSAAYAEAFALECAAIREVRQRLGLRAVVPMVPFIRTPQEADQVLEAMDRHGLRRGEDGLEIYAMVELPSAVFHLQALADRFDGFSIGSNDLTQFTLGLDRDSALVSGGFDANDPAVLELITLAIRTAHRCGRPIGICGEAPATSPALLSLLLKEGIDSISVQPDALLSVHRQVAALEASGMTGVQAACS
jgi:pyruvate,water dikinase